MSFPGQQPIFASLEAIAREWHENWKDARSLYYAEQILRRLEADVFPAIGRRPIAELELPELLDMLRKVEKRGANEMARSSLAKSSVSQS